MASNSIAISIFTSPNIARAHSPKYISKIKAFIGENSANIGFRRKMLSFITNLRNSENVADLFFGLTEMGQAVESKFGLRFKIFRV